jgi:phosphonate transport system permease protein
MPLWISYTLYRLESNIRSASVVGMVGAGGIGVVLYELLRSFQYAQTCAVLILIVILVSLTDWASSALRRRQI